MTIPQDHLPACQRFLQWDPECARIIGLAEQLETPVTQLSANKILRERTKRAKTRQVWRSVAFASACAAVFLLAFHGYSRRSHHWHIAPEQAASQQPELAPIPAAQATVSPKGLGKLERPGASPPASVQRTTTAPTRSDKKAIPQPERTNPPASEEQDDPYADFGGRK